MASHRVAERYSRSLLELAIETNKVDRVFSDIKYLKESLASSELLNLILSPIIGKPRKNAILHKVFAEYWDPLTMKFVEVVTRKGRENVLPSMVDTFFEQYNEYKGITNVKVTSAQPMTEESLRSLRQKLIASGTTRKQINLETRVNPDLIGGFILEYNNKQYDASVRGRLHKLKKKLVN